MSQFVNTDQIFKISRKENKIPLDKKTLIF